MTIRRQYQLPNCSLILDGLSIDPEPGKEEVMSLLVNAECRISGLERSLNGGYNFFAALVRAVSQYSQEMLSGFAHPQVIEGEPLLVHVNPGDGPYHHLVVQPEIADLGESGDGRAIDIKLSSVQLFDLTEAVDQFFADNQTLPELQASLAPLPRRFVRTDEPLSDRALPALLGFGSLVAATMALSILPVPEMREPTSPERSDRPAEVQTASNGNSANGANGAANADEPPAGQAKPTAVDALAAANTDSPLWSKAERITDEATLASLQTDLQSQLSDASSPDANFEEQLTYTVAVNEDGELVGYQFNNDPALRDVSKTPLPQLVGAKAGAEGLEEKAIAAYDVAFEGREISVLPGEIDTAVALAPEPNAAAEAEKTAAEKKDDEKPSAEDTEEKSAGQTAGQTAGQVANNAAKPSASTQFTDDPPATLSALSDVEALNARLKNAIVENRDQPRVGETAASYRVRVSQDGTVTGYEPIDDTAMKAATETPLPTLVKTVTGDRPAVDYRVVFTERGVVEVSPWWGWSYYE
jgi:hypothetical protein